MAKKVWYMHICDFVGNEENWCFESEAEAYKSFAYVVHKEMANDEIKNKDGELVDGESRTLAECLEKSYALTRFYEVYVRECEMTTMKQFMW